MKKIFLLAASFSIISALTAQAGPSQFNTEDDQDPNGRIHPANGPDTPHFQSSPAEGLPTGTDADKYCASMVGDKLAVIYRGKSIVENITLANGSIIFKDGTVISPRGAKRVLKKGECIDKNGDSM